MVTIPKTKPNLDVDWFKQYCDKIAIMQEGPHWYFQDYSVEQQFQFVENLRKANWVWCHNESDVSYYKGLGCKDVRVMRSLMITDGLIPRSEWGNATMIGGNMVSWYGGFDSYIVAREIGDSISAPSMGRKIDREDEMDISHLPYMNWLTWMNNLSRFKYAVHLMPTHAAGTFALNCAYHGIPCIGYKGLDTQELCFPKLSVDVGDLERAKVLSQHLKVDKHFYKECGDMAKEKFNTLYSENVYIYNMKKVIEKVMLND